MYKPVFALCVGVIAGGMLVTPSMGWATEEPKADTPIHTFTPNIALVNNYIFRGLTQTWNRPALQGGIDYNHADGWYASLWGSNVSDRYIADGSLEVDLSAGFNGKFPHSDWSWTAGIASAFYPGANYNKVVPTVAINGDQSYTNMELNAGVGYKWISLKISTSVTDYFGANTRNGYSSDTKWSTYTDLTATIPLPEETFGTNVTLPLHVGHTNYTASLAAPAPSGGINPDYNDFKIGITKGFDPGWSLSLAATHADNGRVYDHTLSLKDPADSRNLGGTHFVISVAKTF
ncbi:MAG: hypothetical protein HQL97_05195 [Magnetococcales bacterium]|nr:hypothetical protein [Magnetococcales bacterium]